jgi:hypothetical protein
MVMAVTATTFRGSGLARVGAGRAGSAGTPQRWWL